MGERKVINKYYPPDFDASKLPKRTAPKNDQIKVRVMLPMTICCTTCREYIYKGKKFNARKETVQGEDYLGLKIFRFYIKCVKCSSEITFKTDPKNSDYRCEIGATRNYEPWKETEKHALDAAEEKTKQESDAFAKLEARTLQMKNEMKTNEMLDELRLLSSRNEKVEVDHLLGDVKAIRQHQDFATAEEDDEREIEEFTKIKNQSLLAPPSPPKLIKTITKPTTTVIKKKPKSLSIAVKPKTSLASLIGSY